MANGRFKNRLSTNKCREFGEWYNSYIKDLDYTTATRVPPDSRLMFHPDYEIPLLRSWYRECPNPANDKYALFAYELNKGHVRQERPKVTAEKVKIWWKNERQREKRLQGLSTEAKPGIVQGQSESDNLETGVRTRKRLRSGLKGSKSKGEGTQGTEDCIVIPDPESEETTPAYRSPQTWSSHTADRNLPGVADIPGEPAPLTNTMAAPLHSKSKQSKKNTATETAFPPQGQDHMLLPGPHNTSWQSNFISWTNQKRTHGERQPDFAAPMPGTLLPWQHRYPLLFTQREGSRPEGEREASPADRQGNYGQLERYKYPQDVQFGASSSSMDFSNIL